MTTSPSVSPSVTGESPVLIERRGNVGILTLNRPRALNSVDAELATAAGEGLHDLDADPSIRVVVLTGTGRAFCAGADLKAIAAGRSIHNENRPEWGFAGIVRHRLDVPVIAAVNGIAFGGGAEIALAADLLVMDEQASLGLPEVKRGLFAGAGGLLRLPHQLPWRIAMEVALTGDPIDAAMAERFGLANRVAPAGTSLEVALEIAERIAANAPLSLVGSKRVVHDAVTLDPWSDEAWALNDDAMATVFASQDAVEGPSAFAEKRAPEWTGT
jgi:enoyl-CoA hydratase/carnithine racemase